MNEEKEKIKYPGFLNKLWYDPIWSKVIYAALIFFVGLLYSFFSTQLKEVSFSEAFTETINYSLPLWLIFIILVFMLLAYGIIFQIRRKRKKHIGKFDVEQPIGNFNFRELYNALLTHRIELPMSLMAGSPDRKGDLLNLFILYQRQLNMGAEWSQGGEQGNFLYYVLGPTLMSYGLTELTPCKNKADTLKLDLIIISKVGYEFYAQIERWRVYNDIILKDDNTKNEIGKPQEKTTQNDV
ncbi:hypothetical protein SYJ56_21500 [Algoriphagus sp. D3-2-R+10]|uniref:hypothetical protein n=1 Tax=Algoriphagus aurantiacus TaxID=3103948 RepID=UPI002B3B5145|nr:hypothetical protein [Algoriphagus sp. D3-2-R+10]MEB2777904.1 hypothetical protein [Algoriphagus sp. D3-2-R+10]